MPGDPLNPVPEDAAGLIGGAAFNKFAKAARKFYGDKYSQNSLTEPPDETGNVCLVRNNTSSDLKRYNVLGVGNPIISSSVNLDEFKRQPTFIGATPSAAHVGKFCVLLENIPAGEIGRALLDGVVPVQVSVTSTSHRFADVTANVTEYLASSSPFRGAMILTPLTSTGLQWCLVRLSNSPLTADEILGGVTDYSLNPSTPYVLLNYSTGIVWKPLDTTLNLLSGYTSGNDQSIGHDASGSTVWQDDEEC